MVERMTLVLDAFDGRASRLRLDDITEITGLPRSTSHRILDQLARLGWLTHTPGGYALGQRALQFGGGLDDRPGLRAAAVPLLEKLHALTGKTIYLGVLEFGGVVLLDRFSGTATGTLLSHAGARVPAHATSLGKAMLAQLSPEEVDALFKDGLLPCTHATITQLQVMHQELRRIRSRHGLAFERDEHFIGVSGIGTAIRGPDRMIAGISLCDGTDVESMERWAPLLLDVAKRISLRLNQEPAESAAGPELSDSIMARILAVLNDDALL